MCTNSMSKAEPPWSCQMRRWSFVIIEHWIDTCINWKLWILQKNKDKSSSQGWQNCGSLQDLPSFPIKCLPQKILYYHSCCYVVYLSVLSPHRGRGLGVGIRSTLGAQQWDICHVELSPGWGYLRVLKGGTKSQFPVLFLSKSQS